MRRSNQAIRALLAAISTLTLIVSCQTVPPRNRADLGDFLPAGALAYVGIDAETARTAFEATLSGSGLDANSTREIAARTRHALAGIYRDGSGSTFTAALSGDFPLFAVGWALSGNADLERRGNSWKSKTRTLTISSVDDTLLLVTTGNAVGERATNQDLESVSMSGDIAIILSEPAKRAFPDDEEADVPVTRAVFAFDRVPTGAYDCLASFDVAPGKKARVYLPVAKMIAFSLFRELGFSDFASVTAGLDGERIVLSAGGFREQAISAYAAQAARPR